MEDLLNLDIWAAIWLGILTSISPCPLATNIAAISFISKKMEKKKSVLFAGLAYTLGRVLVYTLLGFLIVRGLGSISTVSVFLQDYMNKILGPLLVFLGLILLNIIKLPVFSGGLMTKAGKKIENLGAIAPFLLGALFALSFCPVSAGLFFGSLFSLAIKNNSEILLPLLYGTGTALPVIVFSIVIAFSANKLGFIFNSIKVFEKWARKITAIIFVLAGLYYCWNYLIIANNLFN